jgi:hypothetical protein
VGRAGKTWNAGGGGDGDGVWDSGVCDGAVAMVLAAEAVIVDLDLRVQSRCIVKSSTNSCVM